MTSFGDELCVRFFCIPTLQDTVDAVQKWKSNNFRRLLIVVFQLLRTAATCLLNTWAYNCGNRRN